VQKVEAVKYLKELVVLYVEDDEIISDLMTRTIQREVQTVHRASNGEEGLELFKEVYPDIVITDIRMPKMNGIEMIQKIREIDSNVKILITSAFSDVDFLVSAIKHKTNGYILKPVDRNELFTGLNEAAKSIHYEQAMKRFMKYIQDIIDVQKSLIVIRDQNLEYVRANQNFLKYFECDSVEDIGEAFAHYDFISGPNSLDLFDQVEVDTLEYLAVKESTQTAQIKRTNNGTIDSFILNVSKLINDDGEIEYLTSLTDISELYDEKLELEDKVNRDYLTGLYNRHKFYDDYDREIKVTKRYNLDLSIVIFDIDDFKYVNDTYGHNVGDEVLKSIASLTKAGVRESDSIYRWGGEEFIILLPNSSAENAYELTERIRKAIEQFVFHPEIKSITCSFGISEYRENVAIETIIEEADSALYSAKKEGKNKTTIYRGH
jgi:diguanylate cyclase (GGDEF)-like protein